VIRLLACLIFALSATCVSAETYLGRKLDITDGRSDPSRAAPLIIAMHGFLGTSSNMRKKTRFDALAQRHGLIVAYPNGHRRRWNDGRNARGRTDDVSYLAGLIRALVADGRADPDRIFLSGHSNGGGMALRMACDRADLIAGIAVVATKIPSAYRCDRGPAVPVIFFHGTADPIAPHEGRPQGSRLGATLSGAETLDLWIRRNRCRGAGEEQAVDRVDDGTAAQITIYRRCAKWMRLS